MRSSLLSRGRGLLLASTFSPRSIPGLALWLDGARGLWQDSARTTPATADGDPVGAWDDQSGNGRNATQATASKRGTLKLGIVNGRQVVRFDGTDDFLATAANFVLSGNTSFTAFATTATAALDATYRGVFGQGAEANGQLVNLNVNAGRLALDFFVLRWLADAGAELAANTFYVLRGNKTAGAINTTSTLARNGVVLAGAGDANTPNVGASALRVGCLVPTGYFWQGDIRQLLIYSPALSTADARRVERYLSTDSGVSVS